MKLRNGVAASASSTSIEKSICCWPPPQPPFWAGLASQPIPGAVFGGGHAQPHELGRRLQIERRRGDVLVPEGVGGEIGSFPRRGRRLGACRRSEQRDSAEGGGAPRSDPGSGPH